jgi:hypothetical protein
MKLTVYLPPDAQGGARAPVEITGKQMENDASAGGGHFLAFSLAVLAPLVKGSTLKLSMLYRILPGGDGGDGGGGGGGGDGSRKAARTATTASPAHQSPAERLATNGVSARAVAQLADRFTVEGQQTFLDVEGVHRLLAMTTEPLDCGAPGYDALLVAGAFASAAARAAGAADDDVEEDVEEDDDYSEDGGGGKAAAAMEEAVITFETATKTLKKKGVSKWMEKNVPALIARVLHAACVLPAGAKGVVPTAGEHYLSPSSVQVMQRYNLREHHIPGSHDITPNAAILPELVVSDKGGTEVEAEEEASAGGAVQGGRDAAAAGQGPTRQLRNQSSADREQVYQRESRWDAANAVGMQRDGEFEEEQVSVHLQFAAKCLASLIRDLGIGHLVAAELPSLMDKVLHATPGRFDSVTLAAGNFTLMVDTVCKLRRADAVLLRRAGSEFMGAMGFSRAQWHNPIVPLSSLPRFEDERTKSLRLNLIFSEVDGYMNVTIPWRWSVRQMWSNPSMRSLILRNASVLEDAGGNVKEVLLLLVFCMDATQVMRCFGRSEGVDQLCNFGVKVIEHGLFVDQLGCPQMLGYGEGRDDTEGTDRLLNQLRKTQDGMDYPSVNDELEQAAIDGVLCLDENSQNPVLVKTKMHSACQDMAANSYQLGMLGQATDQVLPWSNVRATILRLIEPFVAPPHDIVSMSRAGATTAAETSEGTGGTQFVTFANPAPKKSEAATLSHVRFGRTTISPSGRLMTAKFEQSSSKLKLRIGDARLDYSLVNGTIHAIETTTTKEKPPVTTIRLTVDLPPTPAVLRKSKKSSSWVSKGASIPVELAAAATSALLEIKLAPGIPFSVKSDGSEIGSGAGSSTAAPAAAAELWLHALCKGISTTVEARSRDDQDFARGKESLMLHMAKDCPATDEGKREQFNCEVRAALQTEANVFGAEYGPLKEAKSAGFPVLEPTADGIVEICLVCSEPQKLCPGGDDWGGDGHVCSCKLPVDHGAKLAAAAAAATAAATAEAAAGAAGEEEPVYCLGGIPFANLDSDELDTVWDAVDAGDVVLAAELQGYLPDGVAQLTEEQMKKLYGSARHSVRPAGCQAADIATGALHQGTPARTLAVLLFLLAIGCSIKEQFTDALLDVAKLDHRQMFHTSTKTAKVKCSLWTGRAALLMWKNIEELCTYKDSISGECIWPEHLRVPLAKFAFHLARSSAVMLTGNRDLYRAKLPKFVHHTYMAIVFARILFGPSALTPSLRARLTQPAPLMRKYAALYQTFQALCEVRTRVHAACHRSLSRTALTPCAVCPRTANPPPPPAGMD